MKSSDLKIDEIYAVQGSTRSVQRPGILLDTALWTEADARLVDANGRSFTRRIVRRAPENARVVSSTGWRSFLHTAFPMLVLHADASSFTGKWSEDRVIVESAESILLRAKEAMNILKIVDPDHDGRATEEILRSHSVTVPRADGTSLTLAVELHLQRPQSISDWWASHLEKQRVAYALRMEEEREQARLRSESSGHAQDFTSRLTSLLGDLGEAQFTPGGERYDFHRTQADVARATDTYEVSASIVEKLLALAEKGMTE